eukprot:NODE_4781_length_553_cov_82.509921_g3494_i0.p1 GENE.NODE_4781_length_553_cov_82.509921_g3494_i0~~NODE_4781_length_553_cov_82.509921_g3494_i0.p1  ORF type:complete len:140 (+),score=28.59 NODE_4781_length_553_cov_82.509921_g3494_i0:43-420(+)
MSEVLSGSKKIGFYFSAHWCPPCRGFTPKLSEAYKAIKAAHPEFEIIFVTSDRDEASFKEYFASMPFLALPFGDQSIPTLKKQFNITGIPALVIVDGDGNLITKDGRNIVHADEAAGYTNVWDKL